MRNNNEKRDMKEPSGHIERFRRMWDNRFTQLEITVKNSNLKTIKMENKQRRKKNIAYWTITILLALGMLSGGMAQLLRLKPNVEGMTHLGYPLYIMSILGTWKILGVLVLLLPKFRLLKEWAYAGFFFVLTGAVISHIVSGDTFSDFCAPLSFVLLTVLSWWWRPDNRKLSFVSPAK
jgi:hypothetical protein